jgi:hypothetical protein
VNTANLAVGYGRFGLFQYLLDAVRGGVVLKPHHAALNLLAADTQTSASRRWPPEP